MRKIGFLIGLLAGLLGTSALADAPGPQPPPGPPQPQMVLHNGSLMQVISKGANLIDIRYVQPRPDLFPYAQPGTLLIRGQWGSDGLNATAFTISRCGQMPYPMHGSLDPAGNLIIQGMAPLLDFWSCRFLAWIWSPTNSYLVFQPILPQR